MTRYFSPEQPCRLIFVFTSHYVFDFSTVPMREDVENNINLQRYSNSVHFRSDLIFFFFLIDSFIFGYIIWYVEIVCATGSFRWQSYTSSVFVIRTVSTCLANTSGAHNPSHASERESSNQELEL